MNNLDSNDTLYLLPSHPSITCSDPLGCCEDDQPFPSAWAVFVNSIAAFRANTFCLWNLPDLVQDLAYSLHDNGKADAGFLRRYIKDSFPDREDTAAHALLEEIVRCALALPILFPTHTIPYLCTERHLLKFSRAQVKSLVAHQLLGTLKPPRNNTWGCTFSCWYSTHQPLKYAVRGYLSTLFHYFQTPTTTINPVLYEYYFVPPPSQEIMHAWLASETRAFDYLHVEAVNSLTHTFPHNSLKCMLISSNSSPGFGAACTQEELISAACPELLPLGALCISPPVSPYAALLAEGIIPMSSWKGERRDARLSELLNNPTEYNFLLLDACELDNEAFSTPLPDLDHRLLLRDLHKAYTGFSLLRRRNITEISAPLWGAGAFGADPVVKTLILAMAGALTGVTVRLAVDETRVVENTGAELPNLLRLLQNLRAGCAQLTVQQLWLQLSGGKASDCRNGRDLANMLMENM